MVKGLHNTQLLPYSMQYSIRAYEAFVPRSPASVFKEPPNLHSSTPTANPDFLFVHGAPRSRSRLAALSPDELAPSAFIFGSCTNRSS